MSDFIIDIDGCILSPYGNYSQGSRTARDEIAELSKVHDVRICTGRGTEGLQVLCSSIEIESDRWMIAEGGALFYNPTTGRIKLHPAITKQHLAVLRRVKRKVFPAILREYSSLQEYVGHRVVQMLEMSPDIKNPGSALSTAILESILRDLRASGTKISLRRYLLRNQISVGYAGKYLYVMPPGVNKGSAIRALAKEEGWNPETCVVIGDTEFDISMFRAVRHKMIGCPSNSTIKCKEYVKDHGGLVSLLPCASGVLDIMEWFLDKRE